jgi:hypothetical protein
MGVAWLLSESQQCFSSIVLRIHQFLPASQKCCEIPLPGRLRGGLLKLGMRRIISGLIKDYNEAYLLHYWFESLRKAYVAESKWLQLTVDFGANYISHSLVTG